MKRKEKQESRKLRRQGKSIIEIAKMMDVSKSSVSVWVRDLPQPKKFTAEYKAEKKRKHLKKLAKLRKGKTRKKRLISSDGRWMIPVPEGYQGKTYERKEGN